jgi:hypothetical protein
MRRFTAFALAALVAFCFPLFPQAAKSTTAEAVLAERMLAAIGGRSAWASLRNTVNDSQQNRLEAPTVVRSVISMEFDRPRFRIETTAPGLRLVRVIDGDRHWRLNRAGAIEPVPADLLMEERKWYAGHVYRTLHRIAARDPALRLDVDARGRLEVYEGDARIAWYALDADGVPYAFGAHDDEIGSICGPWDFEQDGIRHPIWVSRPDGTWRANIKSLQLNAEFDDALFAEPQ